MEAYSKREEAAVSEFLGPPRRRHKACHGGVPRFPCARAGLPLFTLHPNRAKAPTKFPGEDPGRVLERLERACASVGDMQQNPSKH